MINYLIISGVALVFGFLIGYFIRKSTYEKKLKESKKTANDIIESATDKAKSLRKDALLEAKDESNKYRKEQEAELKERRQDVKHQENRLVQRETSLDKREGSLDSKENSLEDLQSEIESTKQELNTQQEELSSLITEQQEKLHQIGNLSGEEARSQIMDQVDSQLTHEKAELIRQRSDEAKSHVTKEAKELIVQAIEESASDTVADTTISTINLPNEDMKGRIIGKDGRNIRSFEAVTGIDLIIDDTPEVVVLSGYDPVRREIARISLEKLIKDGRIHPTKIEETVDKTRQEMDDHIRELGEQTVYDLGISGMHPDLIKLVGKLNYRTSYGQNVLSHSIEVARLSGVMASELGEDPELARRAGLLHDIGKSVDREIEGSHVEIGVDLAKKYNEPEVVVNTIASHHEDTESTSIIASIVTAADSISAARPGARSESLDNYIHRLEKLEEIANDFDGVDHSYAIQAGREIRVIVKPDKIDDDQAIILSRDIKNRVEKELKYPGYIKVTVIREVRNTEYAK